MTTAANPTYVHVVDYAIDSLVWCRKHLDEKLVPERLRELEIALAAVALAADHQMDGRAFEAGEAIRHADWSQRRSRASGDTPYDCW